MPVATEHVLHGIQTPTQFLSQISDARPTPATELITGTPAGHPQPMFRAVRGQAPAYTFTTSQLATLLALTGFAGVDLSAGNTDLYLKKITEFGTRAASASTVHRRLRMAQALLFWSTVSLSHQGEGTASCRIVASYDGTNQPIVPAGSVALSGTSSAAEYFGAGPVVINGVELDGIQDVTIESGITLIVSGSSSELWPTFVAIKDSDPMITIRSLEAGAWSTFGLAGTPLTALTVYARKKQANGGNLANATAEHLAFTASSGIVLVEDTASGGNEEAVTTLKIPLAAPNSTTNALLINTATAIT